MKYIVGKYFKFLLAVLLLVACENEPEVVSINLINVTVNGSSLADGNINVNPQATFQLTFSKALDANKFEAAFSLTSNAGSIQNLQFNYVSASSQVQITASLETNTVYRLLVNASNIGQANEMLMEALDINFTTSEEGEVITSMAPCLSASNDCLRNTTIQEDGKGAANFNFYSSFPLDLENAQWENLKNAIIVIHGVNRNADDYFSYMANSLVTTNKEDETVLIAPFFKSENDAQVDDLFWTTSNWREGQEASGNVNISSFTVLDQLIKVLANAERFPVLENIIITGHSSGALFTHVYAAASEAENMYTNFNFQYIAANSQYFYYPSDLRFNANTGQFEEVTNCTRFNQWPLGFVAPPSYLIGTTKETVDRQIIERKVIYLLGNNDKVTTGTLNTSDCEAVLLGEHRFNRGENIFRLMESNYTSLHQNAKIIVQGVGHNAQEMYQSAEFLAWLRDNL